MKSIHPVMDAGHASDEILAQGSILPASHAGDSEPDRVRLTHLYLDADSRFRWYEGGVATDADGPSLRTAIDAARLKWPQFQVSMLKGKPIVHLREADIPDIQAAGELDRTRKK